MSSINIYRFTKMIYPNYVILFYSSKNKRHFIGMGIDKYIILYINYIDKKIIFLKDYLNYFKNNKINYIVIKDGNISIKEEYNDLIYLDYYYKSIISKLFYEMKNIKN